MPEVTPEQRAREVIDTMLAASGWTVQTKDKINLSASRGVAICELSFATGEPDYTLLVEGKAIGTVGDRRRSRSRARTILHHCRRSEMSSILL